MNIFWAIVTLLGITCIEAGPASLRRTKWRKERSALRVGSIPSFLLDMKQCIASKPLPLRCDGLDANTIWTAAGSVHNDGTEEGDLVMTFNIKTAAQYPSPQRLELWLDRSVFLSYFAGTSSQPCSANVTIQNADLSDEHRLNTQRPPLNKKRWISLELNRALFSSIYNDYMRLLVKGFCKTPTMNDTLAGERYRPYLVMYFDIAKEQLSDINMELSDLRRDKKDAEENANGYCGLQHHEVNATRLFGNVTIVYPERLEINYCRGACGNPGLANNAELYNTAHARIRYFLPESVPRPQCVAKDYMSVTIILQEEDSFVLWVIDNLAAKSCQCL